MTNQMNATVVMRGEISHGLLILRIKPDAGVPEFAAGQYTVLGLPGSAPRSEIAEPDEKEIDPEKIIKRAYSIASSSLEGEYLEFYVALVHTGALTPRLFSLQEGDRVWVGKKIVGMFTLKDANPDHDVVFVSTGTGLAPYVSMIRSAYNFERVHKTMILHGARVSWDLGYRRELEGLDTRFDTFKYIPTIDEKDRDPDWGGRVGFVNACFEDGTVRDFLGHDLDPARTSVFLCGNPLMIQSMEKLLLERGFRIHSRKEPGNLFREKFWND